MKYFKLEENLIIAYVTHLNSLFHQSILFIVFMVFIMDLRFENWFHPWLDYFSGFKKTLR